MNTHVDHSFHNALTPFHMWTNITISCDTITLIHHVRTRYTSLVRIGMETVFDMAMLDKNKLTRDLKSKLTDQRHRFHGIIGRWLWKRVMTLLYQSHISPTEYTFALNDLHALLLLQYWFQDVHNCATRLIALDESNNSLHDP